MPRSSKYFFTVLLMYLGMNILSMMGLIKPSLNLLAIAWIAAMALPLMVPAMARQLHMKAVLWERSVGLVSGIIRVLSSLGSRRF